MKTLPVIFLWIACAFCVAQTPGKSATPKQELSESDLASFPDSSEIFAIACAKVDPPTEIDKLHATACRYYVGGIAAGIVKYVSFVQHYQVDPKFNLCIPDNTSPGQLVEDVVDFIKKNPQIKGAGGGDMAVLALLSKYPCKANGTTSKPSQP